MQNIKALCKKTIALTAALWLSATAHAAVSSPLTFYTDINSFLAATGPVQTETFNSYTSDQPANAVNFGAFTGHNSISVDAVNLSYSWDGTPNLYVNTAYGGWADLQFNAPVTAFGAWFVGVNSRATIKIDADSLAGYGSYSHLGMLQATASVNNTPQFIGFTSTQAFNRIVFEGAGCCSSNFAIDNVVHTNALAPVPEPETYAMLAAGLGLVGAVARRRSVRTQR